MDRGQQANSSRMPGLNSYSFNEGRPGNFNDHRDPRTSHLKDVIIKHNFCC